MSNTATDTAIAAPVAPSSVATLYGEKVAHLTRTQFAELLADSANRAAGTLEQGDGRARADGHSRQGFVIEENGEVLYNEGSLSVHISYNTVEAWVYQRSMDAEGYLGVGIAYDHHKLVVPVTGTTIGVLEYETWLIIKPADLVTELLRLNKRPELFDLICWLDAIAGQDVEKK